ncbi:MAG: hypothetical protein GX357_01340 [Firmicutes bacterium]|nr:hypothetical protein [Bacillota bacterium]
MKKRLVVLLTAAALITVIVTACSHKAGAPAADYERELLHVFLDGQPVFAAGCSYAELKDVMKDRSVNGKQYFCAPLAEIADIDFSEVQGAFLEAVDGYVSYVSDISNLYLAAFTRENGEYESIVLDGKHVYAGIEEDGSTNKGVKTVYLVTTPAEFRVEIQKNGDTIGEITLADFMRKTTVGEKKIATSMYDGSFLYDGGASVYEGRFLGINYETMLAKLKELNLDLGGTIKEVEYYGTNGLGKVGKNEEYALDPEDPKYFGSLDFFCMFDGKTYNDVTTDTPIGLTAFVNGSGGRWMTYNLSAINFVIE